MSALTSLLVRDRIVSVSKIEEALHAQVFQGGDIEILLLEMGVVAEDVLSAYRAALFDLLPATREEVMKARDALRRVPAEMARSLGIVPIFFEGRSLVVAAWEPLDETRRREIEAQLGWEVSVRIVNQARLAAALAHHYGFELEPRLRRLVESLRKRDPGVVPYVRPPTDSMRPIARRDGLSLDDDEDSDHPVAVSIPPLPPPPSMPAAQVGDAQEMEPNAQPSALLDAEPLASSASDEAAFAPLLDQLEQTDAPALEPVPGSALEQALLAAPPVSEPISSAELSAVSGDSVADSAGQAAEQSFAADDSPAPVTGHGAELEAVELREFEGDDELANDVPRGVSPQLGALVRGPVTLARAVELLQVAGQRDDVLFVLLRYVQQFFDFSCVFSVGKDGVRARMAHGAGLPRDLVEHVFVPSPRAGLLAEVIASKRAQLGTLGSSPEEHAAATLLHREASGAGQGGLALPLDINQRVVLIVYADRVGSALAIEHASQVQAVVPAVCSALRRIILEAKSQRLSLTPAAPASAPALALPAAPHVPAAAPGVADTRAVLAERASAHLRDSQLVPTQHDSELELELESPATGITRTPQNSIEAELEAAQAAYDQETEAALADFEARHTSGPDERAPGTLDSELSAVDLDAFERLMREDATSDLHVIATGMPVRDPGESAQVRERIAGVPRSAPPPPRYEPAQPPPVANGYRHRGSAGLAQERLRVEVAAAANLPLPNSASLTAERKAPDATGDRKLSLVEPATNEPSVIIDMGESVDALVSSLLKAPPNSEPREIEELLQIGESALPVLMQHFPGPLWATTRSRRRPQGRDVSAVARAVVAFGDRAAPYLATMLAGGDPERSYYALLVAGEIVHADLLDPVARRVLDREESLRALALEVLRSYAVLPQYDVVVRAISDLTERPGKDPRRQRLAVEALGALRDARTLRTLLVRLSDRDEQVVQAAHHALVVLTGQDFGFSSRKWESWVEGWGRAHRVEWLIESLLHGDEGVRTIAGEELKLLTQQYFGYHPSLSKRERELAQRKYREWWEFEGRLSFGR